MAHSGRAGGAKEGPWADSPCFSQQRLHQRSACRLPCNARGHEWLQGADGFHMPADVAARRVESRHAAPARRCAALASAARISPPGGARASWPLRLVGTLGRARWWRGHGHARFMLRNADARPACSCSRNPRNLEQAAPSRRRRAEYEKAVVPARHARARSPLAARAKPRAPSQRPT